ncbi:MAG: hypothetical protein QN187_13495 [Armatimonadota bacterium]|nr:hypothetical protein [Armatimonadota bacterium]MDR7532308.1 hypothetical protein [Armatimonadota bacterium]
MAGRNSHEERRIGSDWMLAALITLAAGTFLVAILWLLVGAR